jgi:hypothetical protein
MDSAKAQLADKLKSANNVLVTVSRNPSVDQLAACLGLTLLLTKLNKHAAAVFSGEVPSTIEFLKPDETIEKNTDSLRDFIIALDKSKADKLRYKVEDNVVRIFITPYRTSISDADLEFSQGDFNVDVVVALGVGRQEDLDEAITAHGRILHDASVASINVAGDGGLGSIIWRDPQASSLSELVTELAQTLGEKLIDNQTATALLTGIVAETNRFSNDKTSSQTMSASATLMAAGANQQLVATELQKPTKDRKNNKPDEPDSAASSPDTDAPKPDNGTLEIDHNNADTKSNDAADNTTSDGGQSGPTDVAGSESDQAKPAFELPSPQADPTAVLQASLNNNQNSGDILSPGPKLVTEPPTMGGTLTANSQMQSLDPVTDPLSMPEQESTPPLLNRDSPSTTPTPPPVLPPQPPAPPVNIVSPEPSVPSKPSPSPVLTPTPSPAPPPTPADSDDSHDKTLIEIEQAVGSEHLKSSGVDAARDEVSRALNSSPDNTPPPANQALNAKPLGGSLHANDTTGDDNLPVGLNGALTTSPLPGASTSSDPAAPPPVPPPIPFQFGTPGKPPSA